MFGPHDRWSSVRRSVTEHCESCPESREIAGKSAEEKISERSGKTTERSNFELRTLVLSFETEPSGRRA